MAKKCDANGAGEVLYTMRQVAEYSRRAYDTVKYYYALGILPNPVNTTRHVNKTTRLFTREEMESVRNVLVNIHYGDIADMTRIKRERYAKPAAMVEAAVTSGNSGKQM